MRFKSQSDIYDQIYRIADKLFKRYNPLINLRWNNKDKIWMNNKLYNEKFEPLYPDLIPKENNNGS